MDGTAHEGVELDQPGGAGAGVAVDGLVVVPDAEDAVGGSRDETQQQEVRRREVLELIDQEDLAGPLGVTGHLGLGEQDLDGSIDLLVEVHLPPLPKGSSIVLEEALEALDVAVEGGLDLPR